jgi:ankyrin repeat protein
MNIKRLIRCTLYLAVVIVVSVSYAGAYEDFFKAIELDDVSGVQRLLERGMDPDTRDPRGQLALYVALREGSLRVADVLLSHPGLHVDLPNAVGETPLMMAALRGQFEIAQRLYARGATVERPGWTPLHYAASGPSLDLLRWLLELRAPINARSPDGTTPLMLAAGYGLIDATDELLQRGADATARNERGLDAAAFARRAGRDALAARIEAAARSR